MARVVGETEVKISKSSRMGFYIHLAVAFLIFVAVFALLVPHARPTRKLRGYILTENEPVAEARVRFQGHILSVLSKSDGAFVLPVLWDSSSRITDSSSEVLLPMRILWL